MTYEEKSEIVIRQLREDRDRLLDVIEQIRTEIEDYGNKLKLSNAGASIEYVLQIVDKYR